MGAIAAVVVVGAVGAAAVVVDGNAVRNERLLLQSVADIAAIAAVKAVARGDSASASAIAITELNLPPAEHGNVLTSGNVEAGFWSKTTRTFTPGGGEANAVRVTLNETEANGNPLPLTLASVLDTNTADITASAIAAIRQKPLCVLALNPSGSGIRLEQNNDIFAADCTIWSNATHNSSIAAIHTSSQFSTADVRPCAAGKVYGTAGDFSAFPLEDCQYKSDPLISRALPPDTGGCDHMNIQVKANQSYDFTPGSYCGFVTIQPNADLITFAPGIYIFKGTTFHINNNNGMLGENVLLHFTDGGGMTVESNVEMTLTGRYDGPYAGFVITEARDSTGNFTFESNTDFDLVGVVYLPNSTLGLGADTHMSINAPWAGFVVNDLVMWANADLTLNIDFDATPVPVPPELEQMFTTIVD